MKRLGASCLILFAVAAAAEPRTWTMVPGTGRARFRVEAPLDAIDGATTKLSGTLSFDEEHWSAGTGRIAIDLKGFGTGLALRDEDLRDQFFQVDRFPEAVLALRALERPTQGVLVPGRDGEAYGVGTLSLHGRELPVRIPVTVHLAEAGDGRDVTVTGTLDVPFTEWGIPRPVRLFLKLGTVAHVRFEATFHSARASTPAVALTPPAPAPGGAVARPAPRLELSFPVAHRPPPPARPRPVAWEFAFTSPEGRGERLFRDPAVGGPENGVACASCHGWRDERGGAADPAGHVAPNGSVWNSARRASFWRGFASTPEDAANLCVKRFMLRRAGADTTQLADLGAYLRRISPDVAPPLDYAPLMLARRTAIDRPTGGDGRRGAVLTERFCGRCHGEGAMRPPLTVGLYEPDYLVARVRWISPHDARQMPPMGVDRLTDSELRDVVTYLVGAPQERVFQRRGRGTGGSGHPALSP